MTITIMSTLGDIDSVMATTTGQPYIQVLLNATQSRVGTSILTATVAILLLFAAVNLVTTASRQLFAFARDQGLPFSKSLAYVLCQIPVLVVLLTDGNRFNQVGTSRLTQYVESIALTLAPPFSRNYTLPLDSLLAKPSDNISQKVIIANSTKGSHHSRDILPPIFHNHRLHHRLQRHHVYRPSWYRCLLYRTHLVYAAQTPSQRASSLFAFRSWPRRDLRQRSCFMLFGIGLHFPLLSVGDTSYAGEHECKLKGPLNSFFFSQMTSVL